MPWHTSCVVAQWIAMRDAGSREEAAAEGAMRMAHPASRECEAMAGATSGAGNARVRLAQLIALPSRAPQGIARKECRCAC